MKSISILGCGWLGIPVGEALLGKGYLIKGSTTSTQKLSMLQAKGIRPYFIALSPQVEGELSDFFAADTLIVNVPPRRKSNGTGFFLQQMEAVVEATSRGDVQHVLFVSSTSVYPDVNRHVKEGDEDPASYMVKAEELFLKAAGIKTTVLRFGGLVGPLRHPGNFLSGKSVGGGDHPVNVIHLEDCIEIMTKIIDGKFWGFVFNACSDEHPTKREFYSDASRQIGKPLPEFSVSKDGGYKIVESERLKNVLGYQFRFPDPLKMKY